MENKGNGSPFRRYTMHLTGQIYEEIGEGRVQVTARDGRTGVFRWDGPWIEGELRDCNVNMLIYTGGPDMPEPFRFRWSKLPADVNRPSGWPEQLERHLSETGVL